MFAILISVLLPLRVPFRDLPARGKGYICVTMLQARDIGTQHGAPNSNNLAVAVF